MFYPADLAVMYPYERSFSIWTIAFSAAILIGISALCIWQARARPYLLMGWLWFLGTHVPVIGLVQVGSQAIADRYTYIPYFGLFIMLVWGLSELTERLRLHRFFAYGIIAAVSVAFIALSYEQASYWRNSEALYRHTLAVTRNNYLISYNLCHAFVLDDRLDEAEAFCRQSVAIKPDYFAPYNMLGIIDFKRARFAEAEVDFETAVLLAPAVALSYSNLAQAQSRQGKAEQAEDSLRKAVELSGGVVTVGFANVLSEIAAAYAAKQNHEKSAENLRRVIYLRPDDAEARARLAFALYSLDRYDEAEAEARNSLALRPNVAGTWNTLGLILLRKQKYRDAADAFQKVIDAEPDHPDARANLARAKAGSG
jgi:Flp pilus assembly protein TadD